MHFLHFLPPSSFLFFLSFLLSFFLSLQANEGTLEGDLFLVKHLLILREQLTPFDINFSQLRRKLDFTSTRAALSRFFGSPGSTVRGVFRWSRDNALLELAKAGLPMVDEHFVDAKHDLGR